MKPYCLVFVKYFTQRCNNISTLQDLPFIHTAFVVFHLQQIVLCSKPQDFISQVYYIPGYIKFTAADSSFCRVHLVHETGNILRIGETFNWTRILHKNPK